VKLIFEQNSKESKEHKSQNKETKKIKKILQTDFCLNLRHGKIYKNMIFYNFFIIPKMAGTKQNKHKFI